MWEGKTELCSLSTQTRTASTLISTLHYTPPSLTVHTRHHVSWECQAALPVSLLPTPAHTTGLTPLRPLTRTSALRLDLNLCTSVKKMEAESWVTAWAKRGQVKGFSVKGKEDTWERDSQGVGGS